MLKLKTMLTKILKWAYGDTLKYVAFLTALAAFIGLLMTFIAYPIETITFLVIGFATLVLFTLFSEWR